MASGRKDESGDFTKGAGLVADHKPTMLFNSWDSYDVDRGYEPIFASQAGTSVERLHGWQSMFIWAERRKQASKNFGNLESCCGCGYTEDRVRIDPSVVRGLEYYTGPVFEAEMTSRSTDDDGRPVRFGSVGGGGRYDGLVARFRAEPVPATGFSIGVSRLLAALRAIKSPIVAAAETPGPVVVLALDRDADSMANYQRLVASLRSAGIAAELYLGSGGMNAQLKYADRRRSRVAVIQGSNERNAAGGPQVTIRDLKLGAELGKTTKDRADYLELRQRAQFAVEEGKLVERVGEVLARR